MPKEKGYWHRRKDKECLEKLGFSQVSVPKLATSEGLVTYLKNMKLDNKSIFYPHSSKTRDVLLTFLQESGLSFTHAILYDTQSIPPKEPIDLNSIDELYFSSPSTLDAFLEFFHTLPESIFIKTEGSVTCEYIKRLL